MKTFAAISAILNLGSVLALLLLARKWSCHVYDEGHKDGFRKGLEQGERTERASIDNWWLVMDEQVGVEREKIWREEE